MEKGERMSDATIWWAAELDASDREKLLQLLKTKPEVNPVGQRLPFEVRNDMNITKETAPVGTRVLILDESDIIREASVAEYSPEGRVKMQFDTWTQWFTTVNVNVLEILDADANTNASESLQSCLVALQEIYEDSEQFSVLGVRTAIKRLLRDHGVYVPTEFRYPTE